MGKYGFRTGKEKEYSCWCSMKTRVINKNHPHYDIYGGRGIKICERWLGDSGFENFYNDMGPRPKNYTLDRINVNGDYCPENCRWTTIKKQGNNRRDNKVITFKNESLTMSEWADKIGIKYTTLHERLRRGMSIEKALTMGVQKKDMELKRKAESAGLSSRIIRDRKRLGWEDKYLFTIPKQKNQQWRKKLG